MIAYSVPVFQHGQFVGAVKMELQLDQQHSKPIKRERLDEEDANTGNESEQKETESNNTSALDDLAK